ncbi:MAG: alkaline phosphatase family protein [bacterium]
MASPPKWILTVVDAMHPGLLSEAVAAGAAPAFGSLMERGELVEDCVSSFPSVTPVASSEILTGLGPGGHWVMGMNWFHRVERRYIEYGSSFEATRIFGLFRAMYDLVYNMNLDHLSWEAPTLFESLGASGVKTATTPFLIYRGSRRHELSLEGLARRAAEAISFRHAVWGPDEFFYGDLYTSRPTECGSALTRPGDRDEYAACASAELIAADAFDFLLLSLPDNDFHSHRQGPSGQIQSIARADRCFQRLIDAAGGLDSFLARYAVILTSDHAQVPVNHSLPLIERLSGEWAVLQPNAENPESAEIAVSPTSRAAAIYLLHADPTHSRTHERLRGRILDTEGVDLIAWLADSNGDPVVRNAIGFPEHAHEAVVERNGLELRFSPGGPVTDRRGVPWSVRGDSSTLEAESSGTSFDSHEYPDALSRLWSALISPHAGDILVSAAAGYEFVDWGGVTHVGGGSHGALAREDSLSPLLFVGCGPTDVSTYPQWTLRDIAPVILGHFGVPLASPSPSLIGTGS